MKKGDLVSRIFFFTLFAAILILSFFIVKPFLTALMAGALLAYIAYPLYAKLVNKIKSKTVSALIVSVLVIFLVSIPSFLILSHLTQQAQTVYVKTKDYFGGDLILSECTDGSFVCNLIHRFDDLLANQQVKDYLAGLAGKAISFLTEKITNLVIGIPQQILMVFLAVFTMYYLLKDGKDLFKKLVDSTPLHNKHRVHLTKRFCDVTHAIIFGSIIIAVIQGAVAALGLWIAGVTGFLWWGLITIFAALIPFVGAWFVWFPISLYLGLVGYVTHDNSLLFGGIFLLIYGALVISTIDNIVKPFLVAGRAYVHPLLILFGVIGGLITFGFMGLFIGPIVLGLLQTMFKIFYEDIRK